MPDINYLTGALHSGENAATSPQHDLPVDAARSLDPGGRARARARPSRRV